MSKNNSKEMQPKKQRIYKSLQQKYEEIDKKIQYHLTMIDRLKAKKEKIKGSKSEEKIKVKELLNILAEKGLSIDDVLAKVTETNN